jgi:GLPGLI family protein
MSQTTQTEIMDLFITDSLTSFRSRNRFKRDSIIENNKGISTSSEASELVSKALQAPKPKFTYVIYKSKKNKLCTAYDNIFKDNFSYKEEGFPCSWTLYSETSQVSGYTCQKATTSFAGRNYTAWFTRGIPVSDGPHKFSNLPGLIVKISDSRNSYSFELMQVIKPKSMYYLSLPPQKVVITTKRELFLADKAARQDAVNRLAQMGFAVNNQQQVNAEYQNKLKRNNNPIEIKY